MIRTFIALAALTTLAACGNPGKKSAEACEEWLAATTCGEFDFTSVIDCSIYEEFECDVSGYFDCLTTNTTCDDATGIPSIDPDGACITEATCE